jgi:L-cystine uptake protein TcyP (sodium:dicarboxylate symporter family)
MPASQFRTVTAVNMKSMVAIVMFIVFIEVSLMAGMVPINSQDKSPNFQ